MQRLVLFLPLTFVVWVGVSLGTLLLFGDTLPVIVTNLLSLAFLPFLPFVPLLAPLGLVAGYEAWRIPNAAGFTFCMLFYVVVLATIGRIAQRRRH
jgi:hypothetical protein